MKTVREEKLGKATLRLLTKGSGYAGLLIANSQVVAQIDGTDAALVWSELLTSLCTADPAYFGYDGARKRFLQHFAGGFSSNDFVERERGYKLQAKAKLDTMLPLHQAINGSGLGLPALAAFQATNLLSVFEKAKLAPLLKGSHGDAFVRAAARFALGYHSPGLAMMERIARPYDCAKWTVISYLPFLWRPEEHMFLKPQVTLDYATRVGHRFTRDYATELDPDIYASLLDLAAETNMQLQDLQPRDNIDIQSFIWIVGEYREHAAEG